MRKLLLLVCVVMTSALVFSQETPQAELFGGYSYMRSGGNFNGWNAAATVNWNDWLGITADFGGNYASQSLHFAGFPTVGSSAHFHTFTFGPTATYRGNDRFVPFGHFLLGGSRLSQKVTIGGIEQSQSETGFAFLLGGGVDIPTNEHWAFRPQVDLLGSHFSGGWSKSFRLSLGFAYRWGTK